MGKRLETTRCERSTPDLEAGAGEASGAARALTKASSTSKALIISAEEEVGAVSTLHRFALRARISLGDSIASSSNEALPINSGWYSGDRDISRHLKIEGIGTTRCIKVGSIPTND